MPHSFFHAADLHLGAASEGVMRGAPAAVQHAVDTCTYRAFDKLISDAERDRPAFVLFPGDLYNTSDGNLRARIAFREGVERLDAAGIASAVIHGNHDPWRDGDSVVLPKSCHRFGVSDETPLTLCCEQKPVAVVYGQSFGAPRVTKNLAKGYPKVTSGDGGLLQIAMLHGNAMGQSSGERGEKNPGDYAPFALSDLDELGYDYWALGHVHSFQILCKSPSWAVYTGSLQGVSPRERGARGYVRATFEDGKILGVEHVESDVLRWEQGIVDLTDCDTVNEAEQRIESAMQDLLSEANGRPVIVRLTLQGATPLDAELRQEGFESVIQDLRSKFAPEEPFLWLESFVVETSPPLDWAAIRASQSVQAYLLSLGDGEDIAFQASLPRLLKEAAGRTKVDLPEHDELSEMLKRAAARAVGMLGQGRDS